MTGLLVPPKESPRTPERAAGRAVVVAAVIAAVRAVATGLGACAVLALAAWYATDGGSHGTTRDALRIGADAWLLGHGSRLGLGAATVTAVPLGLTLLSGWVCFRATRSAGRHAGRTDATATRAAVLVFALVYALLTVVVAAVASIPAARPHLGWAFVGGFLVSLAGGGLGLGTASGRLRARWELLPETARAAGYAAAVAVLGTVAAGGLLVAVALLLDLGAAANVLAELRAGTAGSALYTVVVAAVAPNAALFGAAYVLGPGFAVGTGTTVSVSQVTLGPVPAFPLLAALPVQGTPPAWTTALVSVPAVLAAIGALLSARSFPSGGYASAAVRGATAGVVAAVTLAAATLLAGGAVGPGRMADVGAGFSGPLLFGLLSFGVGGVAGAVLGQWRFGVPAGPPQPKPGAAEEPTADLGVVRR